MYSKKCSLPCLTALKRWRLWGILHRKFSLGAFQNSSHSLLLQGNTSLCVCVSGKQIRREQLNLFASNSPMGTWTLTSVIKLLLFTVGWICCYFNTKLQKTPVLQKAEQGSGITFFNIVLTWLFVCVVHIEESERGFKEEEPVRNSGGSHVRDTAQVAISAWYAYTHLENKCMCKTPKQSNAKWT